jgi:hypothetical protein
MMLLWENDLIESVLFIPKNYPLRNFRIRKSYHGLKYNFRVIWSYSCSRDCTMIVVITGFKFSHQNRLMKPGVLDFIKKSGSVKTFTSIL